MARDVFADKQTQLWTKMRIFSLIGFCTVAIIVFILFGFYWYRYKHFPWQKESPKADTSLEDEDGSKLTIDDLDAQLEGILNATQVEKIARVGNEYLFITDLDYYAYMTTGTYEPEDREVAIEQLIDESLFLQAGEKEGWITLGTEVFNNPFKDFEKRSELLFTVEENFDRDKRGQIILESVMVFFHNVEYGELAQGEGVEAAKSFARGKIENAYNLVKNQGISMSEAGDILANDESLAQLDSEYQQNAYSKVSLYDGTLDKAGQSDLALFLRDAEVGDISEIIVDKLLGGPDKGLEVAYLFYRLDTEKDGFESITEWIESVSSNMTIEIYKS